MHSLPLRKFLLAFLLVVGYPLLFSSFQETDGETHGFVAVAEYDEALGRHNQSPIDDLKTLAASKPALTNTWLKEHVHPEVQALQEPGATQTDRSQVHKDSSAFVPRNELLAGVAYPGN
ncbi:hypothetical protein CYMTET_33772, partial [Cymbomonas tetramitiformis]